jgi:hypothetical protein
VCLLLLLLLLLELLELPELNSDFAVCLEKEFVRIL